MQLVEDGGGAVLEPKDLLGSREPQNVGYIQLNCSRGRVKHEKTRLFKAKYVFDCVRKSRLLPNLSEYLCKQKQEQKEDRSVDRNIEERMRDPFKVCYNPYKEGGYSNVFLGSAGASPASAKEK